MNARAASTAGASLKAPLQINGEYLRSLILRPKAAHRRGRSGSRRSRHSLRRRFGNRPGNSYRRSHSRPSRRNRPPNSGRDGADLIGQLPPRAALPVRFLAETGCRKGEAHHLTWADGKQCGVCTRRSCSQCRGALRVEGDGKALRTRHLRSDAPSGSRTPDPRTERDRQRRKVGNNWQQTPQAQRPCLTR